jgi:zinc D-Ala-D-Ala carboxypeptidase
MKLSPNFTLEEMLESQTARRKGISEQFTPSPEVINSLRALCKNILQPLRDAIGGPIKVSSGYRTPRLNRAIGGAKNSQHMVGEAADIQGLNGLTNKQLFNKIKQLNLPFDQLIWEFGNDQNPAWVHVSFGPRNRRQVIRVTK